jgi:putative transposase
MQEVHHHRKFQKKIGTRKLLRMMESFMLQHGIDMGRDAFFDLLRARGLLIRKRTRKKPLTTFSNHWMPKYPNLIIDLIPTRPNQLWVSDITYIHLNGGFAYLSLITDAYSRKIVGFYLSENLSAKGCIQALRIALKNNTTHQNLIHHSDRGLQYCSADYVKMLKKNNILISMTQSRDPLENAIAERVNGILKDELMEERYPAFSIGQREIAIAINTYNYKRLHSSIDMLTPGQAHIREGVLKRHWKNYYKPNKQKEVLMNEP